jgi:hypothetical protein
MPFGCLLWHESHDDCIAEGERREGTVGMSPNDVVEVNLKMLRGEYEAMEKAAKATNTPPNDFVRRAVADQVVIAPERKKGARIYIKPRVGRLKEVVSD